MTDYKQVQEALATGASPSLLCQTCPWDRLCVTPPSMTRGDVDREIEIAKANDEKERAKAQAEGRAASMPIGTLLSSLVFGGRDTTAQICPVYALRLKSSAGRTLADSTRAAMQSWDDQA